jgi:hypothetical protein
MKPEQKTVPALFSDVGRFWGSSRDVRESIPDGHEVECNEIEARAWLAQRGRDMGRFDVLPQVVFRFE